MQNMNELPLIAYFVQDPEDSGYTGFFPDFPGAVAEGDTKEEVEANLLKALSHMVKFNNEDTEAESSLYKRDNVFAKTYHLKVTA